MDHEFGFLFSLFILIMFWFQTARDCGSLSLSGCRLHFFLAKICQMEPQLLKFSQKAAQIILTGCNGIMNEYYQNWVPMEIWPEVSWRCCMTLLRWLQSHMVLWCHQVMDQQFEKREKNKKILEKKTRKCVILETELHLP